MELILNLTWLTVAAAGFVVVRNRPRHVWLAIACVAAVLFPIISVSDDFNADRTLNDAVAAVVVAIVLFVALVAIARLGSLPAAVYAVHLSTPSDPRSPPAR
jgi:uncharacterized membrane protein